MPPVRTRSVNPKRVSFQLRTAHFLAEDRADGALYDRSKGRLDVQCADGNLKSVWGPIEDMDLIKFDKPMGRIAHDLDEYVHPDTREAGPAIAARNGWQPERAGGLPKAPINDGSPRLPGAWRDDEAEPAEPLDRNRAHAVDETEPDAELSFRTARENSVSPPQQPVRGRDLDPPLAPLVLPQAARQPPPRAAVALPVQPPARRPSAAYDQANAGVAEGKLAHQQPAQVPQRRPDVAADRRHPQVRFPVERRTSTTLLPRPEEYKAPPRVERQAYAQSPRPRQTMSRIPLAEQQAAQRRGENATLFFNRQPAWSKSGILEGNSLANRNLAPGFGFPPRRA